MSEWQPIETAPKDGTRIFLYFPGLMDGYTRIVGYWGKPIFGKARWFDGPGLKALDIVPPTHWQPLPEPPNV